MSNKWIKLFQIIDRDLMEENLNKFSMQHPDSKIRVWTDVNGWWYAQVTYTYEKEPQYFRINTEDEIDDEP